MNPFVMLVDLMSTTQCEQCGARVTVISPSEVIACHCGTTERKLAVSRSAVAGCHPVRKGG